MFDQAFERGDITAELVAAFRIGHAARRVPFADDGDAGDDVQSVSYGGIDRLEVMMFGEYRSAGFEDQREAVITVGFRRS